MARRKEGVGKKQSKSPNAEVIDTLKQHGFMYRPHEKAWTLKASYASRTISDRLARQFADSGAEIDR